MIIKTEGVRESPEFHMMMAEILCNKCFGIIEVVSYSVGFKKIPEDKKTSPTAIALYTAQKVRNMNQVLFDKMAVQKGAIVIDDKHICKSCWDKSEGSLEDRIKEVLK